MTALLVFPNPAPLEVAQALDFAGRQWHAVATPEEAHNARPADGWAGAIIVASENPDAAFAMCRALRTNGEMLSPLLLLVRGIQLDDLAQRDELYDDFCVTPFHPRELERRLTHASWRDGAVETADELVEYDALVLNVATYQAAIAGRPLELTYMEYELLRFLASSPGKVFSREVLLSQVWGYDYFGGARTVDVHIRRLRAKLGDDHAGLIQTVRSVGYSFGESRWS